MGDEYNSDKDLSTGTPPDSQCLPLLNEAPSAQPHPQAYPQSSEPYTNQLPPSYDVQYTANAPDPQAIQFVRVVQHQPQAQHIVITRPPGGEPQSFIVFSFMCLICTAMFTWPCLACTIPALILSIKSRDSSIRGDWVQAKNYGKWACGFNIVALIAVSSWIIILVVYILI